MVIRALDCKIMQILLKGNGSSSSSSISTPCASLRLIGKLSYKQKQCHVIPPVQSPAQEKERVLNNHKGN